MSQEVELKKIALQSAVSSSGASQFTVSRAVESASRKIAAEYHKPSVTDRRYAPRIEHSTDVSVRRLSSKPLTEAQSIDVSRTGIKLSTPQSLPVGSALQLVLNLPGSEDKMTITGIVVWNKPSQQMFEVGIVFASEAKFILNQTKQGQASRASKPVGHFIKPIV
jgi:hypothetical protein